jgi:G3E family GTPase
MQLVSMSDPRPRRDEPIRLPAPPVPVLLIGGFLGSGKTTLVSRLLRDPAVGPRLAVLVNELGALGLDGELIGAASTSAALRTVQLDNGCICCTLRGPLSDALVELARPPRGAPPALILVELSGAALASEVHFRVATQALDEGAPFYADGLVCVVDAAQAERWHEREPALFDDQLRRADLVLLSKIDRATPDQRARSEALVAAIAPRALVVPSRFGDIDPALLLGLGDGAPPPPAGSHHHALAGRTVRFADPVARAALEALLEDASPPLYRIKGHVTLADEPPVLVQCVGEQIDVTAFAGDGEVTSRLTFIGRPDEVARWADPEALAARLGVRAALIAPAG